MPNGEQDFITPLLSEFNTKLRDIEEKQRLLKERVLLIGQNLVESKETIETQITKQSQGHKVAELTLRHDIDIDILNAEKSLLEFFESNEIPELLESTSVIYSEEVNSID